MSVETEYLWRTRRLQRDNPILADWDKPLGLEQMR